MMKAKMLVSRLKGGTVFYIIGCMSEQLLDVHLCYHHRHGQ